MQQADFHPVQTELSEVRNKANAALLGLGTMNIPPTRDPVDVGDELATFADRFEELAGELRSASHTAYGTAVAMRHN